MNSNNKLTQIWIIQLKRVKTYLAKSEREVSLNKEVMKENQLEKLINQAAFFTEFRLLIHPW